MSILHKKTVPNSEHEHEHEREHVEARSLPRPMGYAHIPNKLVVPAGALGIHAHADAHTREHEPMTLDITELVKRKKLAKKQAKELKLGDVAKPVKKPGSPPSSSSSSSSSVSLSPNEIFAFEEEQRLKANRPPLGSPKSVSPRLSPLGRGTGVGARARKKPSSSSSSSKSPKGRKPLTPKFEKFESKSLSPKAKGKGKEKVKGKEGTKRQGGGASGTRKKYKRKLRKIHSRKRR